MAQTGFTPLSLYYSATATNVPLAANLVAGELALNTADGKLFYKDSSNVVQLLGTKGGVGSSATTQVLYNSSGLVVGSANMTFNGTVLTSSFAGPVAATTLSASSTVSGTGFSTYLASPPAIGGTAAAAGTFTTIVGTSVTNSALTATRLVYSGTAGLEVDSANLTFNGTDLTVSGAVNAGSINATTLDLTNLEVTNIKAKDGTASIALADTTGIATFSKATVISTTDNTNAALRITQLGTGNALLVEDSANPDSTPFVIDSSGQVIVGNNTALTYASGVVPQLQVNKTGAEQIGISRFSADTGSNAFVFLKSRGATINAFDVVASGDGLGSVNWYGADGAAGIQAASIIAAVDGTPGTNDMPGRLVFSTTADGASTSTERMRIDSAGNLGLGVSSPAVKLDVKQSGTGWYEGIRVVRSTADTQRLVLGNTSGASWIASVDAAGGANNVLAFGRSTDGTTFTESARIDSAGNVGIGTTTPSASAILDAQSTTKGVRMPNMTTTQKNAIASPAAGLMVFDTTLAKLCVYSGAAWQTITSI